MLINELPHTLLADEDALESKSIPKFSVPLCWKRRDVDEFLQSMQKGDPYPVVITDLGMPFVDGRKVSAAIKTANGATTVLMLTGWGQRLTASGDIPANVDKVLNKPPKLKDLREALARIRPAAPAA